MEEVLWVSVGLLALGVVVLIATWVKVTRQDREALERFEHGHAPDRMVTPEEAAKIEKLKRDSGGPG